MLRNLVNLCKGFSSHPHSVCSPTYCTTITINCISFSNCRSDLSSLSSTNWSSGSVTIAIKCPTPNAIAICHWIPLVVPRIDTKFLRVNLSIVSESRRAAREDGWQFSEWHLRSSSDDQGLSGVAGKRTKTGGSEWVKRKTFASMWLVRHPRKMWLVQSKPISQSIDLLTMWSTREWRRKSEKKRKLESSNGLRWKWKKKQQGGEGSKAWRERIGIKKCWAGESKSWPEGWGKRQVRWFLIMISWWQDGDNQYIDGRLKLWQSQGDTSLVLTLLEDGAPFVVDSVRWWWWWWWWWGWYTENY